MILLHNKQLNVFNSIFELSLKAQLRFMLYVEFHSIKR